MSTIDTDIVRKAISFLKLKPHVLELWFNKKGEYQPSKQGDFTESVSREDILAKEDELPAEEAKQAGDVNGANIEHLMITVNQANEALKAEEGKVNLLVEQRNAAEKERDSYKAQVGELLEGENEAELQPQGESWLAERRKWKGEVKALTEKITELETANVKQP